MEHNALELAIKKFNKRFTVGQTVGFRDNPNSPIQALSVLSEAFIKDGKAVVILEKEGECALGSIIYSRAFYRRR